MAFIGIVGMVIIFLSAGLGLVFCTCGRYIEFCR